MEEQVICVGSVAKDIFFPTDSGDFFDTPEDVTAQRKVAFEVGAKYQIEDRFESLGGVAANTAAGLSRLGVSVSCYGSTGDDEIAAWIRREFEREGVGMNLLERHPEAKSDLSAILVFTGAADRTIFYNRDSAERLLVKEENFSGASWVMVSALNGDWEGNMRRAIAGAKNAGAKLAVNPGQRNMKDNPNAVLDAVRAADLLLLNKDEATELVSRFSADADSLNDEVFLVRSLFEYGAKKVAMTDGARGAWGYGGDRVFRASSVRTDGRVVDTTGAGDAFGSAFLAAEISGKSLEESLRLGIANGANVIRYYGAIEGLLRKDEIAERVSNVSVESVG